MKARNAAGGGRRRRDHLQRGPGGPHRDVLAGTLGDAGRHPGRSAPSFAVGQELAATPGATRPPQDRLDQRDPRTTDNVIAETRGGDPNNVVMAGAHLDSVPPGPASTTTAPARAAILEVAEKMAKVPPSNKVRFAWWGAEESGLLGSTYYVEQPDRRRSGPKIKLYLNFDMVASPNYAFGRLRRRRLRRRRRRPPARPARRRSRSCSRRTSTSAACRPQRHRLRRPLRLRPVHRGRRRHPGRRPVHRRRGDQDRGRSAQVRRHRGCRVRPVLPRALRRPVPRRPEGRRRDALRSAAQPVHPGRQHQHVRPGHERRRDRDRRDHVRVRHVQHPATHHHRGRHREVGRDGRPAAAMTRRRAPERTGARRRSRRTATTESPTPPGKFSALYRNRRPAVAG